MDKPSILTIHAQIADVSPSLEEYKQAWGLTAWAIHSILDLLVDYLFWEKGNHMRHAVLAALAVLGTMVPACAEELPGKSIYERTCRNCHGVEGKGNPTVDSFWKLKIPRLNSKFVQQKSDAELRKIITGGIRKMEPVRMDAPTAPHRVKLTPEQVEQTIAYVRTLKTN
jgi:mono/diheme cytochrome c family protein